MTDTRETEQEQQSRVAAFYDDLKEHELKLPEYLQREWAYENSDGTLHRHVTFTELLRRIHTAPAPRRVLVSAEKYGDPGQATDGETRTVTGTDIVIRIENTTPSVASTAVTLLEDDLGFTDTTTAFTGDGYDIYIHDTHVQDLDADKRTAITRYIRGDVDIDAVIGGERIDTPRIDRTVLEQHVTLSRNGWGKRARARCRELTRGVTGSDEDGCSAIERIDGVDAATAKAAAEMIRQHEDAFAAGVIDLSEAVFTVGRCVVKETLEQTGVGCARDVTDAGNSLRPAPGTFNAETGVEIQVLSRDELREFTAESE
jgi:DNA primase catalytic subunit